MKANKILIAMLVLGSVTTAADAQIIIKVRPAVPRVVRIAAPSPRHVWIDEDWAWRNNNYVYTGGYWAVPPSGYAVWIPGHWKETRRRGWVWKPGHWQ